MAEDIRTQKDGSFWEFKGAVDYVDKWFMMGSPYPMLLILASYLYFVLKCGPSFMKNRDAYKLRKLLMIYNAFQVALSCYIFTIGAELMLEAGLVESYCVLDDDTRKYRILRGTYIYHIAKLTEFIDTIFFVFRKKWNQISFLHVYHHSIMYFCSWVGLKYEPTYSVIFLGTLNSFVHVIMYTYYGLSAFPGLEKYLWWKKYITKLQLIQFLMVLIQMTWNFLVTPCPPSYILLTITWIHGFLFIYLFTDFYVKSYIKKRKEDQDNLALKSKKKETKKLNNNSKDAPTDGVVNQGLR